MTIRKFEIIFEVEIDTSVEIDDEGVIEDLTFDAVADMRCMDCVNDVKIQQIKIIS